MDDFNLENLSEVSNMKENLGEFNPAYQHIKEVTETLFCDSNPSKRIAARLIIIFGFSYSGVKLLWGSVIDKQIILQVEVNSGKPELWYVTDVPEFYEGKTVQKTYAFSDVFSGY